MWTSLFVMRRLSRCEDGARLTGLLRMLHRQALISHHAIELGRRQARSRSLCEMRASMREVDGAAKPDDGARLHGREDRVLDQDPATELPPSLDGELDGSRHPFAHRNRHLDQPHGTQLDWRHLADVRGKVDPRRRARSCTKARIRRMKCDATPVTSAGNPARCNGGQQERAPMRRDDHGVNVNVTSFDIEWPPSFIAQI